MATTNRRTTLADLIAAAELGAIDPTTPVLTADDAAAETAELVQAAARAAAETAQPAPVATVALPADRHDCGIPGCRHGAAHDAPPQPDRQVKLACPNCGAVARMTSAALRRCGGITCVADGGTFAPAARRTYTRRGA